MATENGFITRTAELEFILTQLDGRKRADLLGIEYKHYESKEEAIKWFTALAGESIGCSELAKKTLREIYERMTYNGYA